MKIDIEHIKESTLFKWRWNTQHGFLLVCGAAGGGGGGGAAQDALETNYQIFADGNDGRVGGWTWVRRGETTFPASGGNGGNGGDAGELLKYNEDKTVARTNDGGGDGGKGGLASLGESRLISNGKSGGKGYPGETKFFTFDDLDYDEPFKIIIGKGGEGGRGGNGYKPGSPGERGKDGYVLFIPVFVNENSS